MDHKCLSERDNNLEALANNSTYLLIFGGPYCQLLKEAPAQGSQPTKS